MSSRKSSWLVRAISFLLVIVLVLPCTAFAATGEDGIEPYASKYLTAYSAYVYVTETGMVQVWYEVMGTGTMDEIGTLSILLYESTDNMNWTRVKTFTHEKYVAMLAYNDFYHSAHVNYQGSVNKYYKAYVCVWAGKDGDGDSRYFWAYQ